MLISVAIIDDFAVSQTLQIDDSQFSALAAQHQLIVDISTANPVPQVGWVFNGSQIVAPPGYNPTIKLTKLKFRLRFTVPELVGVFMASASNPMLQLLLSNQAIADYVDLLDPVTIAGVGYIESLGLITADRMNAILTTPPTADELYQG